MSTAAPLDAGVLEHDPCDCDCCAVVGSCECGCDEREVIEILPMPRLALGSVTASTLAEHLSGPAALIAEICSAVESSPETIAERHQVQIECADGHLATYDLLTGEIVYMQCPNDWCPYHGSEDDEYIDDPRGALRLHNEIQISAAFARRGQQALARTSLKFRLRAFVRRAPRTSRSGRRRTAARGSPGRSPRDGDPPPKQEQSWVPLTPSTSSGTTPSAATSPAEAASPCSSRSPVGEPDLHARQVETAGGRP